MNIFEIFYHLIIEMEQNISSNQIQTIQNSNCKVFLGGIPIDSTLGNLNKIIKRGN